jgi:putative spermidine/putrescine transport system ATP-binding protein/spermidine/putrescine transport system ATP-binding protein
VDGTIAAQSRAVSASVRLRELTKIYGGQCAVDALSLTIEPGSMLALLGPSGCGKTTCLRMIAGLVEPSAGEIYVNGKPIVAVPVHRRNIGLLFQSYALFPHMTVAENVAFGLEARRVPRAEIGPRVAEALRLVRLDGYADRMPARLSGGQQQRVALARCLVVEPSLLLLDEPLGALDKSLRENMQVELRALQQRLGITTIMVTHDQDEALTLSDRVAIMRGGRLEQVGTPAEVYRAPDSRFVAGFIGASNFFRGRIDRRDGKEARIVTESGRFLIVADCPSGLETATVALRPEAISIEPFQAGPADTENEAIGIVEQVVYRGFVSHIYIRLDNDEMLIAFRSGADAEAVPPPGTRVRAHWPASGNRIVHDEADS